MDKSVFTKAEEQAAVCKAVSNARRLVILWLLSKGELSVNEIAMHVGSSLQNVSQHLNLLKKTGVIDSRRSGKTIYYQINDHACLHQCHAIQSAPDMLD